jgi:hypothetical protein
LARQQFRDAKSTQRFHVYENIAHACPARKESEPAQAIKPFHLGAFEAAPSPLSPSS